MAHRTAQDAPTAERPPADIAPEVLELLALPPLDGLADEKTRGAACVWGAEPLSIETAVDLGEQTSLLKGSTSRVGMRWFPRACRPCVRRQAMTALQEHTGSCEQCVDDFSQCDTGLALVRLVRECRR
ncbi:hypothetical protein [Streptomyces sp. NPDC051636]|uniref:hypothetical protein n=1 Tax=Streptomyces sp. NPDC051636 TaxID=3365663 RepID=UPI00378DFE6A